MPSPDVAKRKETIAPLAMRYSQWFWEEVNSKIYGRLENVDADAARGWQVILQTEPKKSRVEIERLDCSGDPRGTVQISLEPSSAGFAANSASRA